MSDFKYRIQGNTLTCTQAPAEADKDQCQLKALALSSIQQEAFELKRNDGSFKIVPKDLALVRKQYPKYQPPQKILKDFLVCKNHFYLSFGSKDSPTSLAKQITILNKDSVYQILSTVIDYIAFGELKPKGPAQQRLQELAIKNSVASFTDPIMGNLIEKTLKEIAARKEIGGELKNRAHFILNLFAVRKDFWEAMSPEMGKSNSLSKSLKGSSWAVLHFAFADHILAEKGYAKGLFTEKIQETASKYHEVVSQLDSTYTVEKNFYTYMADILTKVRKKTKLPHSYQKDVEHRLSLAIREFRKKAVDETKRLLPLERSEPAFKISLILKYGNTPVREAALRIILEHIDIRSKKKGPSYVVKMTSIHNKLKGWVRKLPKAEQKEATQAILYLLDQLLERGEKIEAFWDGKSQSVNSFFGSNSFGKGMFGGVNNLQLQELIVWARREAKSRGIPLNPDATPHVHWRKWTFTGELGFAAIGLGTFFIPYEDPNTKFYAQGGSAVAMGMGLGAAGGNALSYALDMNGDGWLFDLGGGIVGGALGGLLYGLTTTKPDMMGGPTMDPGRRNPVDPYGP